MDISIIVAFINIDGRYSHWSGKKITTFPLLFYIELINIMKKKQIALLK